MVDINNIIMKKTNLLLATEEIDRKVSTTGFFSMKFHTYEQIVVVFYNIGNAKGCCVLLWNFLSTVVRSHPLNYIIHNCIQHGHVHEVEVKCCNGGVTGRYCQLPAGGNHLPVGRLGLNLQPAASLVPVPIRGTGPWS